MKTYLDTSAFIKLILDEPGSSETLELWVDSSVTISSVLLVVETASALSRAARLGRTVPSTFDAGSRQASQFLEELTLLACDKRLAIEAAGLAARRNLRGSDAVHLASAVLASSDLFVAGDAALLEAARREGLAVAAV